MKLSTVALAGLLALCWAAASRADVTVSNPWVRATAPGQTIAGAYFKITSSAAAYLVGASSAAAKSVEIHEMTLENNVMRMRPIARLELAAGTAVELKPGGYHLMLIDVVRPLSKGDSVPLTLTVEDRDGRRSNVALKAEVSDLMSMGGQHGAK